MDTYIGSPRFHKNTKSSFVVHITIIYLEIQFIKYILTLYMNFI